MEPSAASVATCGPNSSAASPKDDDIATAAFTAVLHAHPPEARPNRAFRSTRWRGRSATLGRTRVGGFQIGALGAGPSSPPLAAAPWSCTAPIVGADPAPDSARHAAPAATSVTDRCARHHPAASGAEGAVGGPGAL